MTYVLALIICVFAGLIRATKQDIDRLIDELTGEKK